MGRLRQKGKAGAAKAYITRTAAVKKLQCSLADFRRLCILKGIYPREPRSRKKANKGNSAPTSFYYSKDIQYLQHEPVLRKLREHKAFARKLSRAMGRGEWSIAKGLEERKPVYRLDHIVKERYPTFIDAVRDIDDALCLVALFATLPMNEKISPALIENCTRLYNEWQLYIINTRSLKKVFLSIKGVYHQAVVQGETVTWIVPWQFTQSVPSDVDVRVMLTFLELYQTLLGFVFFKLYTDEGWVYPPPLDQSKDDQAAGVGALSVIQKSYTDSNSKENDGVAPKVSGKDVRAAIKEISNTSTGAPMDVDANMGIVTDRADEEDEDFIPQPSKSDPNATTTALPTYRSIVATNTGSGSSLKPLFSGLNFWLSRETPRTLLEFTLRAFGGSVGWDERTGGKGSSFSSETDERITHVIIDRPVVAGNAKGSKSKAPSEAEIAGVGKRKYVQPQWVVDCINAGTLLSEDRYERGKVLPPHLSPFGEAKGAYQPVIDNENDGTTRSKEVDMANVDEDGDTSDEEEEIIEGEELPDEEEEEEENEEDDDVDDVKSKELEEKRKRKEEKRRAKALRSVVTADAAALRAAELEAEAAGVEYGEFEKSVKKANKAKKQSQEENVVPMDEDTINPTTVTTTEKEMNKMMMSNKQRKLYEKMKYSERKREAEKATLEQKKADLQKAKRKEAKLQARGGKM